VTSYNFRNGFGSGGDGQSEDHASHPTFFWNYGGIREIPIAPEMAETAHCSPRLLFIREVVIYRVNQFRD
jgi:hypothetical protein